MFARSVFSSTCGGIRKSTRRPSNDRRTSPETSLSPTRDIRSCARTMPMGSPTVECRAKHPSSKNIGQRWSRSNRTLKPDYATPHLCQTDADVPTGQRRVRSPCTRSRCTCFGRSTILGTSVVDVITERFISTVYDRDRTQCVAMVTTDDKHL